MAVEPAATPHWLTPEIQDLMGRQPDTVVALRSGVSKASIRNWRDRPGICADGVLPELVAIKRRERGIPSHNTAIDWPRQTDLGQATDRDVARRLRVSVKAVEKARDRLGVPPPNTQSRAPIDWETIGLGQRTDNAIAQELGVSTAKVTSERRSREIPPARRGAASGIDWDAQPLGREADSAIARRLGVNTRTVNRARRRRKIAAFGGAYRPRRIDWENIPSWGCAQTSISRHESECFPAPLRTPAPRGTSRAAQSVSTGPSCHRRLMMRLSRSA